MGVTVQRALLIDHVLHSDRQQHEAVAVADLQLLRAHRDDLALRGHPLREAVHECTDARVDHLRVGSMRVENSTVCRWPDGPAMRLMRTRLLD